jgi:nucleoside phosphorylase
MIQFAELISACNEFKKEAIEILGIEQSIYKFEKYHGVFDIAILTATIDEFESVKMIVDDVHEVSFSKNDATVYFAGTIQSAKKAFKVIIPYPYSMGIEAASTLTTIIVSMFRPRYLFMVGICAGNKNICKVGDIIIAEKSLNYHRVVEIERKDKSQERKFMHNICSINGHLKSKLELFSKTSLFHEIRNNYQLKEKIETPLTCHVGLLVTGSSLIRSSSIIQEIVTTYVGVKGLDMETYGLYYASTQVFKDYAPNFVSIKSVSDYGDDSNHKLSETERKKYALYTSSTALKSFVIHNLE